jgi:selenoprotein W-related protein
LCSSIISTEGSTTTISIEYCASWNYTDKAIGAMTEILKQYEFKLSSIYLIPAGGGKFEVKLNDKLIYSKLETGRHAEPGELVRLLAEIL